MLYYKGETSFLCSKGGKLAWSSFSPYNAEGEKLDHANFSVGKNWIDPDFPPGKIDMGEEWL